MIRDLVRILEARAAVEPPSMQAFSVRGFRTDDERCMVVEFGEAAALKVENLNHASKRDYKSALEQR
jgi:hypothetical protein